MRWRRGGDSPGIRVDSESLSSVCGDAVRQYSTVHSEAEYRLQYVSSLADEVGHVFIEPALKAFLFRELRTVLRRHQAELRTSFSLLPGSLRTRLAQRQCVILLQDIHL